MEGFGTLTMKDSPLDISMHLSITWILLNQLWLLLILFLFLAFDGILQQFIHYHRTEQLPKCLLKPFLTLLLIENLGKHEKSWQNVTKVWLKMLTTLHTMLNWHLTVKLPPVSKHFSVQSQLSIQVTWPVLTNHRPCSGPNNRDQPRQYWRMRSRAHVDTVQVTPLSLYLSLSHNVAHGQSEQDTPCDQGHHTGEIDKPESAFQVPIELRTLNPNGSEKVV